MNLILLGIVLLVSSLIFRKKIFYLLLVSYLWILFAFSFGNADYMSYYNLYSIYGHGDISGIANVLFKYACYFCYNRGLAYADFLIIEATIGLFNISFVVFKLSKKPIFVIVLYFIYPFMMDVTQVRFFVASSFALMGLYLYIAKISQNKKLSSMFYLFIFVTISALYHVSCFAYYIMLFLPLVKKIRKQSLLLIILLFEILIYFNFSNLASLVTSESNINEYLSKKMSVFSYIFMIVYFTLMLILVHFSSRRCYDYYNIKQKKFTELVFYINLLMLSFGLLAFIANEFMRLFRIVTILDYIICTNNIFSFVKNRKLKFVDINKKTILLNLRLNITMVLFCIVSNIMFISSMYMDTVILPIFEQNILLK